MSVLIFHSKVLSERTGFRPPFRFGGGGIRFVGDSIENSELARILERIEKGDDIFPRGGNSVTSLLCN